ncbi:MAG: PDR/VanB family oxidoreductase [Burkholderiales bacterium]|nr:PDR/VanB family oxidoreductase [Burkholderiales bacterium]
MTEPREPRLRLRVHAMALEAEGVVSVELRDPRRGALPAWSAGAHLDLHLPNGLTRSYSLVSLGDRDRYVVAVGLDRRSRGGSRFVHEVLRVGDELETSTPRNAFALVDDEAPTVLIAGGIGITPLLAMARECASKGRHYTLHYTARNEAAAPFLGALSRLPGELRLHFDDGDPARFLDIAGVVAAAPPGARFYACGPSGLLDTFARATRNLEPGRATMERFRADAPAAPAEGDFVVALARDGRHFSIPPDRSVLEVLLDAGLDLPFSCQEGVCGQCMARVLEGIPEHRDSYLSPTETASNAVMMICVSRCRGERLLLDV